MHHRYRYKQQLKYFLVLHPDNKARYSHNDPNLLLPKILQSIDHSDMLPGQVHMEYLHPVPLLPSAH